MKNRINESVPIDRSLASLLGALTLAALVPVVCVLWFMNVAMRNERLAVQEQMADVYLKQLGALQKQTTALWQERLATLAAMSAPSPGERFAAIVRANLADAVVVQDPAGKVLYPGSLALEAPTEEKSEWAVARDLEYQKKDYAAAAAAYATIVGSSRDVHARARALQAEATCWLKAGRQPEAIARLAQLSGDSALRDAVSAQGTLIAPNAQLLLLKLVQSEVGTPLRGVRDRNNGRLGEPSLPSVRDAEGGRSKPAPLQPDAEDGRLGEASLPLYQRTLDDLVARLNDYTDAKFPATQRRFLLREVKRLAPEASLPTLPAEDLAADYLEANPAAPASAKLERTSLAKVWRLALADRSVIALYREDRLKSDLRALFDAAGVLPDVRVQLLAPDEPFTPSKLVPLQEAGEFLPGWRLGLNFRRGDPLAEASARQMRFYLWTGFVVIVIITLLALLVARYVSAQMRLARLKNELVSTVSHELKTPLASMRALVETLSAGRFRDERQLREYLALIGKENQRLSQLIENFLTFSRLERGKQPFRFESLAPHVVLANAAAALREKFESARCRFELEVPGDLPAVRGDADALTTVLVNLLDNACKYTDADKHIVARAYANCETVIFEVADNGIGLGPADTKRIFERFYQVDQSLTKQRGGCGLGLSIVQSIVRAHGGTVEVDSELGKGSTFRVKIPIAEGDGTPNARAAGPNAQRSTFNA